MKNSLKLINYTVMSKKLIITIVVTMTTMISAQNLSIPSSPFGNQVEICPQINGVPYNVGGFPGTPYKIVPFMDTFKNPVVATPTQKACRVDGHCMLSFDLNINQVKLRPFDNSIAGCKVHDGTWFLSYNGSIPGPTIRVAAGHESLVRFKNQINTVSGYFKQSYNPCLAVNNRTGRPISVHFHGSASLAPYDGWAEDETCFGEIKDYVYPNNRPVTGWYHDHALHITADNAYLGLAGFKITSSKLKDGGCGEPWNLENIEEHALIITDKVLDNKCQLKIEHFGGHEDNLYGDINLINGIPFPQMNLQPKWIRFRLLNAAVSRPFLFKIKDHTLNDISQRICRIIASDGGFRKTHIAFPTQGLLIGVAERYEIVCNFTNYTQRTVYLWNDFNTDIMKNVPYFCHSHLLSRITFGAVPSVPSPSFLTTQNTPDPLKPAFTVLNTTDINAATAMANAEQYHREMVFGRTNGHWTINGETWDTAKIAASDVGQSTWEVWRFKTGGGWFHPIHMHLVDFFLLRRDKEVVGGIQPIGLRTNEILSPKDVFYLGPSEVIYVLVRFGPHKGDYMFHCHNLIHEDNDMMRAVKIIDSKNTTKNPLTAQPFIINRLYNLVYNNWIYADPMLGDTAAKPSSLTRTLTQAYVNQTLHKNVYRIFYPTSSDIVYMRGARNLWQSQWCPLP
jgi:FtsP/CotA-like multicopper oxidase with cupredoxin domain